MTAQIGILNKKAIVLATDSAVTIQNSQHGKKIYNSVNKLFALSKEKPLAIMVYGNAELLETPWETIVKIYRKQLKSDYKTLKGYSSNFIKWLENNSKTFFPLKIQKQYFKSSIAGFYYNAILDPIKNELKRIFEEKGKVDKAEILKFAEEKIKTIYSDLNKKDYINNYNDKKFTTFLEKNERNIKKILTEFFSNLNLSENSNEQLIKIACFLFNKNIFSENYSGIVIAGFGDNEIYPSLLEFQIEGVFENKIKYKKKDGIEIKNGGVTASIVPFAQDDIMHNYLLGIHPANIKYFEKIFEDYPSLIAQNLNTIPKKDQQKIEKQIKAKNKTIFDKFMKATIENFSNPIISMVGLMPITEMCEFAESLINLTSLRKKVTMQEETVGGETEVVSITKGEGLIWIKRKHYFDPKLNPGFIKNYLNI